MNTEDFQKKNNGNSELLMKELRNACNWCTYNHVVHVSHFGNTVYKCRKTILMDSDIVFKTKAS